MKWINLADRQPPKVRTSPYPIIRRISDKRQEIGIFHLTHEENPQWTIWVPKHNTRVPEENWNHYEWLDESESIHEWGPRLYTKEELDTLLAEQHRNTRHDAVDILHTNFLDFNNNTFQEGYDFLTKTSRDIMNLSIRKPNGT